MTYMAVLSFACAIVAIGNAVAQPGNGDEQGTQKQVLVLHSSRIDAPYSDLVERAFRKTLSDGLRGRLDYYTEYIDFGRFSTSDYESAVRDFLRRKYAGQPLDVVIAEGDAPFNFVVRHRPEVFPGVPIVFSTERAESTRIPNTTGVVFPIDMKGTLDLALRLQPTVRRVFVIRGASKFDRYYEDIARSQFHEYESRVDFTYLPPLALGDLLKDAAHLPPDSILFFLSLFEDGAGNKFIPVDVLGKLSEAANAPVYCWPEMTLGYGVVGGLLLSEESVATDTAKLALRVLHGERADQIPIAAVKPYVNAFDWRQLNRWNMPQSLLPTGSDVRFRTLTVWDLYHWHIVTAVAIILAQAALIAALLLQRRRRQRAEFALQQQRMELAHAGRLATVGELSAAIAHEINQPLTAILSNTDAAELLLDGGGGRLDEVREILADIRKDDLRASEVIVRLRSLLAKHQIPSEPVDLNEVVSETMRLVDTEARHREIELVTRLHPNSLVIVGDRVQLQQVVLNLVINALDAMADTASGMRRVIVETALRPSREVEVAVIDRGSGVSEEQLVRLFEPYFTTKQHGMGLGLSIARTIVEAHGGTIWVETEGRTGAVFRFTLPVANEATQASPAPSRRAAQPAD